MKQAKPDFNQNAARIVKESTSDHEAPLSSDTEEAWEEWSRGVQNVDSRTMALLRAAFLAGVEAAKPRPTKDGPILAEAKRRLNRG